MKKLILILGFINIFNCAYSQTKTMKKEVNRGQMLGIKLTAQVNGLTTKGFEALNNELQKNQINTLPNDFTTHGLSLCFWVNQRIGFEFAYHAITSKLEETEKFINSSIPYLSGQQYKVLCLTEVLKKKRLTVTASIGGSTNRMVFEIVDLQPQPNALGNLLKNPTLSSTVALESRGAKLLLEGALGFDYQLVRSERTTFTIGMKTGYNYQPFKQQQFNKWTTNRTNVPINGFPLVFLDNYFLQFNAAFNFSVD
jgi:hypothetical protein